jgi:hypothetical protein
MRRFFPKKDCDFYVEQGRHPESRGNHILRKTSLDNPVKVFRDQDHPDPHRSVIALWGIEGNFNVETCHHCKKFSRSRIRKTVSKLPIAGRSGLWKITRIGPCGYGKLSLHTWKLSDATTNSKSSNVTAN